MTYCTIPEGIGRRALHALERYAEETGVVLVSEYRGEDRRSQGERRIRDRVGRFRSIERRTIHNAGGRRVAERRAATVPVTAPRPLPRRLRGCAEEIRFLEPLEISPEHVEDVCMARLAVRIQGGEHELFRVLYHQWFDRVYTYARATLERSALAELATQEVFADIHDALPRHEVGPERIRAWMAGVVCRRIHGHLVALHGPEAVVEEDPARCVMTAPHEVPSWVTDADLQVLVSRLPLPQRRVALLRYLMGLSQTEVAYVVERSVSAVADLHASALAALAERQAALGKPSEASGARFAMARRQRSARVIQSRRLALIPG
jgi:DNA-directed RNA polymerase specialized sigma24 family protein